MSPNAAAFNSGFDLSAMPAVDDPAWFRRATDRRRCGRPTLTPWGIVMVKTTPSLAELAARSRSVLQSADRCAELFEPLCPAFQGHQRPNCQVSFIFPQRVQHRPYTREPLRHDYTKLPQTAGPSASLVRRSTRSPILCSGFCCRSLSITPVALCAFSSPDRRAGSVDFSRRFYACAAIQSSGWTLHLERTLT